MITLRVREIAREGLMQPGLWADLSKMTDEELRNFIATGMEPQPAR